jgi:phosphoglycerol transferase MdoB-like AlkP superfamily enzyme
MNKIFFPFYDKNKRDFLRKKSWFKILVFLYFVFIAFLIVIMIYAINGPTAITNCYQGLCAILEIIPP